MRILEICSWLDINKKTGWFFVEQASYIKATQSNIEIDFLKFAPVNFIQLTLNLISPLSIHKIDNSNLYIFNVLNFASENRINCTVNKIALYIQFKRISKSYDVLHAQSLFDAGYYTYLLSRKYKIPSFLTEHNQLNFLKSKFQYNTIKNVLNSFITRTAVSKEVIKQFSSHGFFQQFKVIHNPLDPIFFNLDFGGDAIGEQSLKLLHIGAYTPIKNQNSILKLLKRLGTHGFEIEFTWLGYDTWGHDSKSDIQLLIDSFSLSKNVKISLHPRLEKEQLAEMIKVNDLAISTSLCETFGLGNAECIAMGVPLLTTDNGGSREFTNPKNSIVVPICDDDALYHGFLQWFQSRHQYNRKSMSDEIKKKLSYNEYANRMIAEYNRILSS